MTIGDRIRVRRIEIRLSQDELAKKLGYKSRSSINKIELNLQNLGQSKIKAIAEALETTPSYIMGWDSEEEEKPPAESEELSDEEKQVVVLFRKIPPTHKRLMLDVICSALESLGLSTADV